MEGAQGGDVTRGLKGDEPSGTDFEDPLKHFLITSFMLNAISNMRDKKQATKGMKWGS